MIFNLQTLRKSMFVVMAIFVAGVAQAHTGHGTESLMTGLSHPFGLDHLLAMLAVGLWSAKNLPKREAWQGPATFMVTLILSALLGQAGFTIAWIENGIALSVLLFGLMLWQQNAMNKATGLTIMSAAAALHGLAHGSEAPDAGFTAYALGFLLTTACLHLSGLRIGFMIQSHFQNHQKMAFGAMGTLMSGAGLYLFSQI